jgi:hypothetical protein
MTVARTTTNICPLRYRGDHTATRPAMLPELSVIHISHQIVKHGYKPLPSKLPEEHLYQCRDCSAVWLAASPYVAVEKSKVLGIYERSLVWKPLHK